MIAETLIDKPPTVLKVGPADTERTIATLVAHQDLDQAERRLIVEQMIGFVPRRRRRWPRR